jgi:ribosomal protein S8
MSKNLEVIGKLQANSVWFKNLEPEYQAYVAEYCLNGFDSKMAAKAAKIKKIHEVVASEAVQNAIKEFMQYVLADKADKLESKIIDVLWRRAFYDPFEFVDEEGQPRFDVTNYKEVLGANAVVVEGIKRMVHPKNQDNVWMIVDLADRTRALKELSSYIGLVKEDTGVASSFVVNLQVHNDEAKPVYEIKDYEDVIEEKK